MLTDDDARDLRSLGRLRSFEAGDALIRQGDAPGGVILLLEGHVKVTSCPPDGKEVILAFRGPGDIVGEVAAIAGIARSSAVVAMEPLVTLAVGPREFRGFLETHANAAMNLVLMLIDRLQTADAARTEFAGVDVPGRVSRRLVELSDRFGVPCHGGIEVTLPLTQEELAAWTASSREAVAKALRMLRELGWIETHRRRFVIRDASALRRYAA